MKPFISALLLFCLAASAHAASLPGADRDAHGCIASAGYTWSSLRHSCIRVFEVGIRLNPVTKPKAGAELSAFVIFPLAADDAQVEIFLPGKNGSHLLRKQGPDQWGGSTLKLTRHGLQFQLGPAKGQPTYQGGTIS